MVRLIIDFHFLQNINCAHTSKNGISCDSSGLNEALQVCQVSTDFHTVFLQHPGLGFISFEDLYLTFLWKNSQGDT